MTTVEQLRAQAPRSFDKTLIDLLVAIQHGQAPIQTSEPAPPVVMRDEAMGKVAVMLAGKLDAANARIDKLERVIAMLQRMAMEDA